MRGAVVIGVDYYAPPSAAFTQTQIESLPAALSLDAAGKASAPAGDTSRFRLSLKTDTGAFSGFFLVTDTVPAATATNPTRVLQVTRKVSFAGQLRQAHGTTPESGAVLGAGSFVIPTLAGSSQTAPVTGEIRLVAP